jgi:hypothetical protein
VRVKPLSVNYLLSLLTETQAQYNSLKEQRRDGFPVGDLSLLEVKIQLLSKELIRSSLNLRWTDSDGYVKTWDNQGAEKC